MPRLTTEQRQKEIIDEALNIIHECGYGSLSIRELAIRVKISEPAIYRHFLNKEDIILGILSRISAFDQILADSLHNKKMPLDKLDEFIMFHFRFLEKNRTLTSVIFAEDIFTQSKILKEKLMKIISYRQRLLVEIIEEIKNQDSVNGLSSQELSKIILGFIRITVLEWKLSDFSFSLIDKGEGIKNTFEKLIFNK